MTRWSPCTAGSVVTSHGPQRRVKRRERGRGDPANPRRCGSHLPPLEAAGQTVGLRLAEVYQWLLMPSSARDPPGVRWEALRSDGRDAIGRRASDKLLQADLVRVEMAPVFVGMDLRGVLAPCGRAGTSASESCGRPTRRTCISRGCVTS